MAKTKAGPGRKINRIRHNNNNNNNNTKKYMQNGLYVHSSPPKALNDDTGPATAKIREYIRAGDVEALENVVLLGQGTKLINQHATDQKVRNFLKTVPSYMSKIDLVHDSVEKGNLRDLKALLDRRKLARSKDAQGVGLLHKAVVHGHREIVDYLISDYPETLEVADNEALTVGRSLETVPELIEDQQTPTPSRTPSLARAPALPRRKVDVGGGGKDESWDGDGLAGIEEVMLGGSSLELELADWSASDDSGCYPGWTTSSSSPSSSREEDGLAFSPSVARSITHLLARGRSGRLPRLPTPQELPHSLRLTDHARCVDREAAPPTSPNRGRRAYLSHVRRVSACRPPSPLGRPPTPKGRPPRVRDARTRPSSSSSSSRLTSHLRLPDIPRRPLPGSDNPRPPTPTPARLVAPPPYRPRGRWRRAGALHEDVGERLNAALSSIDDSDSDEVVPRPLAASTPPTGSPSSPTGAEAPPTGSPSPTGAESPPTPVLTPTLIDLGVARLSPPTPPLEGEDLPTKTYTEEARPTMERYVRWVSSRVLRREEGLADPILPSGGALGAARQGQKLDVLEVVYEHDVTYWAKVIVERVLESVINFLTEEDEEEWKGTKLSAEGNEPYAIAISL